MTLHKIIKKIIPNFVFTFIARFFLVRKTEYFHKNPIKSVLKLLRWSGYDLMNKDILFSTPNGTKFISMPSNYSSFVVYFENYRDPLIQKFLERNISNNSVFVDAGANIGTYAVPASQLVGPAGKVIAIEAHPFIYNYLSKNIKLNNLNNVTALNVVLGYKQGEIQISYTDANPGETHIAVGGEKNITIPMHTLDQILEELGEPKADYLKIDVEGFEFPLL